MLMVSAVPLALGITRPLASLLRINICYLGSEFKRSCGFCYPIPLTADKAYDTNKLRRLLAEQGTEAVIPSIARRKPLIPHDRVAYRQRNLIERMFGRLKDFRLIRDPISLDTELA